MAKALPDSRTPRRFMAVSAAISATAASTSWPRSHEKAAAAFCTPEEIDTATVRT